MTHIVDGTEWPTTVRVISIRPSTDCLTTSRQIGSAGSQRAEIAQDARSRRPIRLVYYQPNWAQGPVVEYDVAVGEGGLEAIAGLVRHDFFPRLAVIIVGLALGCGFSFAVSRVHAKSFKIEDVWLTLVIGFAGIPVGFVLGAFMSPKTFEVDTFTAIAGAIVSFFTGYLVSFLGPLMKAIFEDGAPIKQPIYGFRALVFLTFLLSTAIVVYTFRAYIERPDEERRELSNVHISAPSSPPPTIFPYDGLIMRGAVLRS